MSRVGTHTTAFVLAGGGSLGAIEVGMLRELLAWGEAPSFVVGASAGAINAAYFAASPTLEGVSKLEKIWRGLKRQDLFPFNLRSLLGLLTHPIWSTPAGCDACSSGICRMRNSRMRRFQSTSSPRTW